MATFPFLPSSSVVGASGFFSRVAAGPSDERSLEEWGDEELAAEWHHQAKRLGLAKNIGRASGAGAVLGAGKFLLK